MHEKIRILKLQAAGSTNKKVRELTGELNALLASFISEHTFDSKNCNGYGERTNAHITVK